VDDAPDKPTAADGVSDVVGDAAGNVVGAGLGLVFAGPPGALLGAAVGPVVAAPLKRAAQQLRRMLTGRQASRVQTALVTAAADIADMLSRGLTLREDGFFTNGGDDPSSAEEIAEGVLLHAATSYEQRKVPYLGHLLGSIGFRPDVRPRDAHFFTRLIDRLSYSQLVALAVVGRETPELTRIAVVHQEGAGRMRETIAQELEELSDLGLLGAYDATTERSTPCKGCRTAGSSTSTCGLPLKG
jgi:hypothetical protein